MMACPIKKCTLILSFVVGVVTLAPYEGVYVRDAMTKNEFGYGFPRYERVVMVQDPRGFWDFLGNWIQNSNWLPVEINIPDTFGSFTTGISNFTSGIIQRIPFLNNNNGNKPMMLLLPVLRRGTTTNVPSEIEPTVITVEDNQSSNLETEKPLNIDGVKEDIKDSENSETINNSEQDKNNGKDSNTNGKDIKHDVHKENYYRNNDNPIQNVDMRNILDEDGFWAYI